MRSLRHAISTASLLAMLGAVGCSGGGGGSSLAPTAATPTAGPSKDATVAFTFRLPKPTNASSARKRQYLSFATQSFVITVTNGSGTPQTTVINVIDSTCTPLANSPFQNCTANMLAPVGVDTFAVAAYDQVQTSTTPSSSYSGNLLGEVTSQQTIAPGTGNTIYVVLDVVVATVKLVLNSPSPALGTASTTGLLVLAYDADGYLIIGNYTKPISVTDSDTTGATKLLVNGTSAGTQTTTTTSSTAFSVAYNGSPVTATFSGTTTGITYDPATLAPTSAVPVNGIYVMGYDSTAGVLEVDGYDLATQTSVGGSATQFKISKLLSATEVCAAPCYYSFDYYSLGPQNQFVTTAEINSQDYAEYYEAAPIAPSASATAVPQTGPPVASWVGLAEGQGINGLSTPVLEPSGTVLQSVLSDDVTPSQAGQWARFQPGINGTAYIPALATFYLQANGEYGKFDPAGNFWQFSTTGLQEYKASDIANASGDVTLTPIATIQYGTGPGQLPSSGSSPIRYDVSFGANNSVYVSMLTDEVEVFKNVTPGTNAALTASEYFIPSSIGSGYFPNILVDPAGSGNMILVNTYNRTLDYFYGPGPNAPATNGGQFAPYKQVSLPLQPVSGGIYNRH